MSDLIDAPLSEKEEHNLFAAWIMWNEENHPELKLMHHIPNGEKRAPGVGQKLKRMLVRKGIPDFNLPVPVGRYCGFWIELKALYGTVEKHQQFYIDRLRDRGHCVVIAFGHEQARLSTRLYLEGKL